MPALEQALRSRADEWHKGDAASCRIDYRRSAEIVVDTLLDRLDLISGAGDLAASYPELRRLRARIEKLERVAELVSAASVWDHTAYDQAPGEEWLAIDRDHYQRIVDALAGVDTWSPWEQPLERRLGDL